MSNNIPQHFVLVCHNCGYMAALDTAQSNICPECKGKLLHVRGTEKEIDKFIEDFMQNGARAFKNVSPKNINMVPGEKPVTEEEDYETADDIVQMLLSYIEDNQLREAATILEIPRDVIAESISFSFCLLHEILSALPKKVLLTLKRIFKNKENTAIVQEIVKNAVGKYRTILDINKDVEDK